MLTPKSIIRAEMAKQGMTYSDLAKRLNAMPDIEVAPKNLANRIGRGNFDARLFMTCLSAMGVRTLVVEAPGHEEQGKSATNDDNPIDRICPKCFAKPGQPCKRAAKHAGEFHSSRKAT